MRRESPPAPLLATSTPAFSRRRLLRTALLAGAAALGAPMLNLGRCRLAAAGARTVSTRAVDLVFSSTVVDMLGLLTLDWQKLARWLADPASFSEADFRHLERLGVGIFHPAVETGGRERRDAALRWTLGWNRLLVGTGCFLGRIATISDLRHVPERGELGVLIGFQDSDHLDGVADVATFYGLGQRVSQLTYNGRNRLGCGCAVRRDTGLTPFGAEVVAAMNRVGMAIDVSHCGERTSLDAIALSRQPVLITHSNCRRLVPGQRRCKSDAVLRAAAAKGGVMGVTVVRAFVGGGTPTLDDLLDHFDHVRRLVGAEHVGLGSDVDVDARDPATGRIWPSYRIRGLEPRARVFQIAEGLLARGWGRRDVELVLGGNFLRALAAIWSDDSGSVVPQRRRRRDPFCPAPHPVPPAPVEDG